jgi:transcriptional regulator with PAS, ATPase and Fis domain
MQSKPQHEPGAQKSEGQESILWEIRRLENALKEQTYRLHHGIKKIRKIQNSGTLGQDQMINEPSCGMKGIGSILASKPCVPLDKIIGQSTAMQKVFGLIHKAAESDANVVIYGESGTGKELAARAIHELSERGKNEFVAVNCGAIPETLLESEFFGYSKGAFTGAYVDKHGYLDLADGGTLFLDEVGELTLNMQAKLLRSLDDGGYIPVGRSKPIKSDFRIIAASNKDLADRVKKGLMREDFFFRIHIIPMTLPPLRERREDIPILLTHFANHHQANGKSIRIPEEIVKMLCDYHWPGNVRELQNVIHRYLAVESLDLLRLPENRSEPARATGAAQYASEHLQEALAHFERDLILRILQSSDWNRQKAALQLGITRNTLFRKMRKFGLVQAE